MIGSIVKLTGSSSEAVNFCRKHGLTGRIISIYLDTYVVNAGLGYDIFVKKCDFEVLVSPNDIPLKADAI